MHVHISLIFEAIFINEVHIFDQNWELNVPFLISSTRLNAVTFGYASAPKKKE